MSEIKDNATAEMMGKIRDKTAVVGVIGLGYVGLPLIDAFRRNGYAAIGFDVDQKKVDSLKNGKSYIAHIEDSVIEKWAEEGKFDATIDFSRFAEADALLICVPTPLSKSRDPDLKYVEQTTREIARHLRPGQLVGAGEHDVPRHDQGCVGSQHDRC